MMRAAIFVGCVATKLNQGDNGINDAYAHLVNGYVGAADDSDYHGWVRRGTAIATFQWPPDRSGDVGRMLGVFVQTSGQYKSYSASS